MNIHEKEPTLTASVIAILSESEQPSAVTIEYCAKCLAFSMTSFRRKLAHEHTSFKLIQQKYLNELCINGLLTQSLRIDDLAFQLGYSERATFERAFKNKYGTTPASFKELSAGIEPNSEEQTIAKIINELPSLSESCQKLICAQKEDNLDLLATTKIVASDPVLSARIIGVASTAIYGKTPADLKEAIGRNLGISTVINLAVIHSIESNLHDKIDERLLTSILNISAKVPKLLKLFKQDNTIEALLKKDLLEQVLMFGLLGLFVLCHKSTKTHATIEHCLIGSDDLSTLNQQLNQLVGHTIFSSSAMMLSLWHLDSSVIKSLNQLHRISITNTKQSKPMELLIFMLSCLYQGLKKDQDFSSLEEKAELLNIGGFKDIQQLL